MSDYFCPHCGADLDEQPGFDPDAGYWTCAECGQFLIDPEIDPDDSGRFGQVGWFCDGCGAFLNKQNGFSDWNSIWACTECGYVNYLDESKIDESEEASPINEIEYDSDDESGNDDETSQCDYPRKCNYCDNLLNRQEGFEEWRGSFTCLVCGYYNEWSTDDEDDKDLADESDEYKTGVYAKTRGKSESEWNQDEELRAKKAKQLQIKEQRREHRKRFWRMLTRKKQTITLSSDQCQHMHYEDVVNRLKELEFYKISVCGSEDLQLEDAFLEGMVSEISINGMSQFDVSTQFPFNARINIVYHKLKTALPPLTSKKAKRMDIEDVSWEFGKAGFKNIYREALYDLEKGWLVKEDSVEMVEINGERDFKKSDRFRVDSQVVITYHRFKKDRYSRE